MQQLFAGNITDCKSRFYGLKEATIKGRDEIRKGNQTAFKEAADEILQDAYKKYYKSDCDKMKAETSAKFLFLILSRRA